MAQHDLKTQPAAVQMQIIVRDKDGNVKYQGPLNMDVKQEERKEHGRNSPDAGQDGGR